MRTVIVLLLLIPSLRIYPQWTALNGPHPNRLTSIVIDSGTGRIYTCGYDVARYYSDDEGGNWTAISTGDYLSILVKDNYVFWGSDGGGVMRTGLSGSGFNQVLFNSNASFINCIINFNDTIYAGSDMGYVYRSANNGDSWQALTVPYNYHSVLTLSEISNELYAGLKSGGIYKLSPGSSSWTKVTTSGTLAYLSVLSIAYNNGTIVAGTKNNGIYISNDMGSNWTQVNSGIADTASVYTLHQQNGIIYAGTGDEGLLKSTDNGSNWEPINGTTNLAVYCFAANQNFYFIGTSDGIYKSTDSGVSWSSGSNGMSAGNIRSLFLNNNYFYAVIGHSIFRSSDSGNNWQVKYSDFDNAIIYCLTNNDYGIYASGPQYGKSVIRSTDNGDTWQIVSSGINDFAAQDIMSLGNYLFAATIDSPYVYRSGNNGDSWEGKGNGIQTNSNIIKFAKNNSYIFAAAKQEIFRSSDMGDQWQLLPKPNVDAGFVINSIAARDTNIFISSNSGIYRSTDSGDSWELLSLSATYQPISLYFINYTIFAGFFNDGLFYSTDNGNNWVKYNTAGLPNWVSINSIVQTDNFLAVGTIFYGIFTSMNTVGIQNERATIPTKFELFQNFPNPFNPSTDISYSIPRRSNVSLKVFDILGSEVAELVNKEMEAGSYQVSFNASSLSSGVYFYRLQAGDYVKIKKMVILK